MHRVVQEVILDRMSGDQRDKRTQRVRTFVENRTIQAHDNQQSYTGVSEVDAVVLFVQSNARTLDRLIGRTAMGVVPRLQELGRLRSAVEMASLSEQILRPQADSDRGNAAWQRDLSISLNQLGNLAVSQGNLPEAQRLFGEALRIAQRLAESDRGNSAWQRDLVVSHHQLAMLARKQNDEPVFVAELQACFEILDRMRKQNLHFDPSMEQVYQQLSNILKNDWPRSHRAGRLFSDPPRPFPMSTFYHWFRSLTDRWIWGAIILVVANNTTGVYGYTKADPCASWSTICYQSLQLFSMGGPTDATHDTYRLTMARWLRAFAWFFTILTVLFGVFRQPVIRFQECVLVRNNVIIMEVDGRDNPALLIQL